MKLKWKPAYEDYQLEVLCGSKMEVRVCAYGYDELGEIRSTLYCTRDGLFMQRTRDGWMELKPSTAPANLSSKLGKGSRYPQMRRYGLLHCHTLVCTAWHGERPEGYECDHINGNNLDWSADNLRWVTKEENIRCGCYLKRLRKHGIDPKRLRYSLLLGLYDLTLEGLDACLKIFDERCGNDPSPLSETAINGDLQLAYMKCLLSYEPRLRDRKEKCNKA